MVDVLRVVFQRYSEDIWRLELLEGSVIQKSNSMELQIRFRVGGT